MNKKGAATFTIFIALITVPYLLLRHFNIHGSAFFALLLIVSCFFVYVTGAFKHLFYRHYSDSLLSFLLSLLLLSIPVKIEYSFYNSFLTAIICITGIIYIIKKGMSQVRSTLLFLLICLHVVAMCIPDNYFYSYFWKRKPWSAGVTWASYKKTPPGDDEVSFAASTNSYIDYKLNYAYNYPPAVVIALMCEDSSWTKYNSPVLLIHEQGHFNLNEIYTRKAIDSIKLSYPSGAAETKKIIDYFIIECDKQQDKYDNETNHSQNQEVQNEWTARIEAALKSE